MAKKSANKAAAATDGKAAFKKSMSVLAIMGVPIKTIAGEYEDGQVHLCDVAGTITRMRATRSKFGEGVGFKGVFAAIRNDGARFEFREFFAPSDLQDELQTAWAQREEGVNSLDFAARISIIVDPEAKPLGYTYLSEPLGQIGATNPSEALFGKLLALEAPKK